MKNLHLMKQKSKITLEMQNSEKGTKLIRLENGIRIIFDPLPHLKSTSVGIWVNIGTRHENDNENGIAHLLEHMVFKGAGGRNAKQLAEDAEERGIYLNASTSYERTGFYARCLQSEALFAFNLCADLILKPHFEKEDFILEKNVVLHEINEAFDDAEDRAGVLNQMAAFTNQALGRPILGDEKSLEALTQEILINFHKNYLNPENLIIAFGGAYDEQSAIEEINKRFGALKTNKNLQFQNAMATNFTLFEARKTEQLQIVLSMYAPSAKEDLFYASQIFGAILGGGMASRLFQDLRENRGLVYGIDTYLEKFIDIGRLNIGAGTNKKSAREVIMRTIGHIEDLANLGPNEREMQRAKKTIETSMMMALENSSSRISSMVNQVSIFDKILNIDTITCNIANINMQDIMKLANLSLQKQYRAASAVGTKGQEFIEEFLAL